MKTTLVALSAAVCVAMLTGVDAQQRAAPAAPRLLEPPRNQAAVDMQVLHVQRNVYMLIGDGGNTTVQIGDNGALVVDPKYATQAQRVLDAIRKLSDKPLHTIVQTHLHDDHAGATDALVTLRGAGPQPVRVIAHENVLNRMVAAASNANRPLAALPINSEYFTPTRDFFLNGEAIVLYHAPAAHTD